MGSGRRGRPVGFRLSEESKRAISASKTGQKHREATKTKISESLITYHRNKNPLSEELTSMYCEIGGVEVCDWMLNNERSIDAIDDVMTLKSLRNARRIEITKGVNIEYISHEITPELLVLFMEECERLGKDPSEWFDELGYWEI